MSGADSLFCRYRIPGLNTAAWALLSAAALVCSVQAQQVVRQGADLRVAPDGVSRSIARLPAQTPVEQLDGRFGPWVQVRTDKGLVGWLPQLELSGVRFAAPSLQVGRPPPQALPLPTPAVAKSTPAAAPASARAPTPNATTASSAPLTTAATVTTVGSAAAPSPTPAAAVSPYLDVPIAAPADAPTVAVQRLQLAQSFQADSEAARRFAFQAALELVKLPAAVLAGPGSDADRPLPDRAVTGAPR